MNSDYSFIRYETPNQRKEIRISITKNHTIGLPTTFYMEHGIAKYKFAILFFDPKKSAVAIHFTNNREERGKFGIIHDRRGKGASISVTSFFKSNKIDPLKYCGKYDWKKMNLSSIGDVFVLDLLEQ
nr:Unknown Function [uncultured bacterium]